MYLREQRRSRREQCVNQKEEAPSAFSFSGRREQRGRRRGPALRVAALAYAPCRRACARPHVAGVAPAPRVDDLLPAFGHPIVLEACDKQHAEDERHNEVFVRGSREERTTDELREEGSWELLGNTHKRDCPVQV